MRSKFAIELSDGRNIQKYSGELVNIDPAQIDRLLLRKPINGLYTSSVYRLSDVAAVETRPPIQIENQFPYDISVELAGPDSKHFRIEPSLIPAGANLGLKQIRLYLRESLADLEAELEHRQALSIEIKMRTSNEYVNELLDIIADLKVKVNLMSRNDYEPKIQFVEPKSGIVQLKEGNYDNEKIGVVKGVDRDRGDPGRIEYHMIGNDKLFSVDLITGVVRLNGRLDAELERSITFYLFAKDLDPQPLGNKSS